MNTMELVATYLKAKEDVGLAETTLRFYGDLLRALALDSPFLPLSPDYLQGFIRRHGGQALDSLRDYFRAIRTFYAWLVRRGYLAQDLDPFPKMDRPKGKSPIPRIISVEEIRKLVEASTPPYDRALILTLVDAMVRIGELADRTKDHLSGGTLEVFGKTGGRLVPLDSGVFAYLLDLPTHNLFPVPPRAGRGGDVIDRPAAVYNLRDRVRRVMLRSGLRGRKLGPHTLRHSSATAYINAGGDLKSLSLILGHTTIRMSERYVTLALDALRQKHATFGVMQSLRGSEPAVVQADLPQVELPQEAVSFPVEIDGRPVRLFLKIDRRKYHTFYYLQAREYGVRGGSKWPICSLGTDLPLNIVDAYRQAIHQENQRRSAIDPDTLIDKNQLLQFVIDHPEEVADKIDPTVATEEEVDLLKRFTE